MDLTKLDEIIWKGEEFTEEELLRMNNLWRVKGYYGTREFYQPMSWTCKVRYRMRGTSCCGNRTLSPMRKE